MVIAALRELAHLRTQRAIGTVKDDPVRTLRWCGGARWGGLLV